MAPGRDFIRKQREALKNLKGNITRLYHAIRCGRGDIHGQRRPVAREEDSAEHSSLEDDPLSTLKKDATPDSEHIDGTPAPPKPTTFLSAPARFTLPTAHAIPGLDASRSKFNPSHSSSLIGIPKISVVTSNLYLPSLYPSIHTPSASTSVTPSPSTASKFSVCTRRCKAVLIACGYQKTVDGGYDPLPHSWKDVMNLKKLLIQYGWHPNDITVLVDHDFGEGKEYYPTRENIIKHLTELAVWTKPGDLSFFHYSGHGDQRIAQEDKFETDGMDEYIMPCDFWELRKKGKDWYILDDELRRILVDTLTSGARLIAVVDACSSGTILDLPVELTVDAEGGLYVAKMPRPRGSRPRGSMKFIPKKSSTLPPYGTNERARQVAIKGRPIFLPLRLKVIKPEVRHRVIDNRVIHGKVVCISSCPDNAFTFETTDGGILITHFCKVMREVLDRDEQSITLKELDDSLKKSMLTQHESMKAQIKANDGEWDDSWQAPVPQFCFSHKMEMDTLLLNLTPGAI